MLRPISAYRFRVDFIPPSGLSEEYQMFLTGQVQKTRINYTKKQVEIWFMMSEEGPLHELTEWFVNYPIDLELHEMNSGGELVRTLRFTQCKIVDNEIVYDYSSSESVRNYTVWSYVETSN